jgi:signal transduction histidine kinase/DNA-binding response OmpR family regulator
MSLGTPSVDPEPAPGPAAAKRARPEAAHAIRVLLVDDDERNLAALDAMLADLDADFVKARSGEEVLRCLLQQDFALILLDVRMPGLDGFETAALIRTRDRSRHTPIIFFTAFEGDRAQVMRGYGLGAVDFLSKPVVPEVLRGKVAALIELHRKNEELQRQAALLHEAERRDQARRLDGERRRWREEALHREMERERAAAAALARSNARLRALSGAASELLRDGEPLHAAPRLFEGAAALGAELGLWYAGSDALRLAASRGLDDAVARAVSAPPPGDALVERAAAERRHVVLRAGDAAGEAGVALALGARAAAAFPLLAGGRLHGVLAFASREREVIEEEDVAALAAVADHVAAALERARLVAELSRRAAELREADARKDTFLAMLGHELRNPLAPVLNAVKLVQRRASADPPLERVVAAAGRQIAHMTRLLDDLLDVSRVRNGKIELKRSPVDLARVVSDALQAAEPLVQERRHALAVRLPDEPVVLYGDPVRLSQVVGNLVLNAAKYTDRGGHLSLTLAREGEEAVLRVSDDGIGIAPEMLSRVFEMFVQVEQGSDRAQGGLGLGLTLVKSLVELHGGIVVARSAGIGRGSEFEVRLPARRALAEALPAESASAGARRNGAAAAVQPLQIVLVEDNADIRESLRALLELSGHTVEEAEDGRRGVDLIRTRRPNVALVDIGLPGMDGYEVARELRDVAGTRLIAMTGYGRPEDRQLALDSGFHAHLVKPVDFDDLTKLLAEPP